MEVINKFRDWINSRDPASEPLKENRGTVEVPVTCWANYTEHAYESEQIILQLLEESLSHFIDSKTTPCQKNPKK